MASRVEDTLTTAVAPRVEALGLELFDIELTGRGRGRTVRVLVDRQGGVDLDAITKATEAVSEVLDAEPEVAALLDGPYLLEVSSPGLERSLRTPAHFHGRDASPVSIKTRGTDGVPTRRRVTVVAADDDGIEVEADNGERERIAYDAVEQARTVFDWGPAEKPGRARKATTAARR